MGIGGASQVVDFLEAGASGYSQRTDPVDKVLATIEGVSRGRAPCAPRIAADAIILDIFYLPPSS